MRSASAAVFHRLYMVKAVIITKAVLPIHAAAFIQNAAKASWESPCGAAISHSQRSSVRGTKRANHGMSVIFLPGKQAHANSACQAIRQIMSTVRYFLLPVSYTHLDVYKRQAKLPEPDWDKLQY